MSIQDLYISIIEDGKVDSNEVIQLKNIIYSDLVVSQNEADILFKINDVCSENDNAPEWNIFFINVISDYLLNDKTSPGEIDENEVEWLINSIGQDSKVSQLEKKLLRELKSKSKSMPERLKKFIDENE